MMVAPKGPLMDFLELSLEIDTDDCIIWPFLSKTRDGYPRIGVNSVKRWWKGLDVIRGKRVVIATRVIC
jgi:hypothetical protein